MPDKKPTTARPERKMLTPDQLQELYGITFSDQERMLLTHGNALLSVIEGQHAYVLKMALTRCECPACQGIICQRSADPNWGARESTPDDAYMCPFCKTRLTWHLAFWGGGQSFTINPGQTITIGEGPVTPEGK